MLHLVKIQHLAGKCVVHSCVLHVALLSIDISGGVCSPLFSFIWHVLEMQTWFLCRIGAVPGCAELWLAMPSCAELSSLGLT